MSSGTDWPEARCEELRELVEQRLTATQIAERMGTTRNAILGKSWRLGLTIKGGRKYPSRKADVLRSGPARSVPSMPKFTFKGRD